MNDWGSYFAGLLTLPWALIPALWLYLVAELIFETSLDFDERWKEGAKKRRFFINRGCIAFSRGKDKERVVVLRWPWYWQHGRGFLAYVALLLGLPVVAYLAALVLVAIG